MEQHSAGDCCCAVCSNESWGSTDDHIPDPTFFFFYIQPESHLQPGRSGPSRLEPLCISTQGF